MCGIAEISRNSCLGIFVLTTFGHFIQSTIFITLFNKVTHGTVSQYSAQKQSQFVMAQKTPPNPIEN